MAGAHVAASHLEFQHGVKVLKVLRINEYHFVIMHYKLGLWPKINKMVWGCRLWPFCAENDIEPKYLVRGLVSSWRQAISGIVPGICFAAWLVA